MLIFRKFRNNFIKIRAIAVLGPNLYIRYIFNFIFKIFFIYQCKDLKPLDKKMGSIHAKNFKYNGKKFKFDTHYCDQKIKDGTYAFGVVREIYIRDCYFKYLPQKIFQNINYAVDIGSNRGAFSAMLTTTAKFILSVEAQEDFKTSIEYNFNINNFRNYSLEVGFVGAGGELSNKNINLLTIEGLLDKHNHDYVDLIKMDIEGSEFALFDEASWLNRVGAICMEVHSEYGSITKILKALKEYGFEYKLANEDLILQDDPMLANFIYAWR